MQNLILASFLIRVKQVTSLLTGKKRRIFFTSDYDLFLKTLKVFQELLLSLSREDFSRDVTYLRKLSETWTLLKSTLVSVSHPKEIDKRVFNFVSAIETFPSGEDFPLGYYLLDALQEQRFPFPFMDKIFLLYQEYQTSPETSTLNTWLLQAEQILDELSFSENLPR